MQAGLHSLQAEIIGVVVAHLTQNDMLSLRAVSKELYALLNPMFVKLVVRYRLRDYGPPDLLARIAASMPNLRTLLFAGINQLSPAPDHPNIALVLDAFQSVNEVGLASCGGWFWWSSVLPAWAGRVAVITPLVVSPILARSMPVGRRWAAQDAGLRFNLQLSDAPLRENDAITTAVLAATSVLEVTTPDISASLPALRAAELGNLRAVNFSSATADEASLQFLLRRPGLEGVELGMARRYRPARYAPLCAELCAQPTIRQLTLRRQSTTDGADFISSASEVLATLAPLVSRLEHLEVHVYMGDDQPNLEPLKRALAALRAPQLRLLRVPFDADDRLTTEHSCKLLEGNEVRELELEVHVPDDTVDRFEWDEALAAFLGHVTAARGGLPPRAVRVMTRWAYEIHRPCDLPDCWRWCVQRQVGLSVVMCLVEDDVGRGYSV